MGSHWLQQSLRRFTVYVRVFQQDTAGKHFILHGINFIFDIETEEDILLRIETA